MLSVCRSLATATAVLVAGGALTSTAQAMPPHQCACGASRATSSAARVTTTTTWALSLNAYQVGVPYRLPAYTSAYSSMMYYPAGPSFNTYLPSSYPPMSYPYQPLYPDPLAYPQSPTLYPSNAYYPNPNVPVMPSYGPANYVPNTVYASNNSFNNVPYFSYPSNNSFNNVPYFGYPPMSAAYNNYPGVNYPLSPGNLYSPTAPVQQPYYPTATPSYNSNPYANSPGNTSVSAFNNVGSTGLSMAPPLVNLSLR